MPITFGKDNVLLSITKILLIDSCSLLVRFVSDIFLTENSFKIKQVFFCCNRFLCFLVRQKFVKSQKSFSVKKLWRVRLKTKTSFLSFFHFLWIFEGAIWPKVNSVKKVQKMWDCCTWACFCQKWRFLRGNYFTVVRSLRNQFLKTLTLSTNILL